MVEAVRVIRCGERRAAQAVDARRVQRMPERSLLCLGAEQLEHRDAGVCPARRAPRVPAPPSPAAAAPDSPSPMVAYRSRFSAAVGPVSPRRSCSSRSANASHIIVRSWPSEPLATLQPPLSGPTRFSAGTRTSVKKTSLKSRSVSVVDARERPAHHAGGVGGNQQRADALVLRRVGIGADEGEQDVGVVRARRPHLLAVDDEVVAVDDRTGAQAARSEPAPGSLMPSDAVISARRIGTAHRCFCSSVPNDSSDAAMMPTPCGLKL